MFAREQYEWRLKSFFQRSSTPARFYDHWDEEDFRNALGTGVRMNDETLPTSESRKSPDRKAKINFCRDYVYLRDHVACSFLHSYRLSAATF